MTRTAVTLHALFTRPGDAASGTITFAAVHESAGDLVGILISGDKPWCRGGRGGCITLADAEHLADATAARDRIPDLVTTDVTDPERQITLTITAWSTDGTRVTLNARGDEPRLATTQRSAVARGLQTVIDSITDNA